MRTNWHVLIDHTDAIIKRWWKIEETYAQQFKELQARVQYSPKAKYLKHDIERFASALAVLTPGVHTLPLDGYLIHSKMRVIQMNTDNLLRLLEEHQA